MEIKLFLTSFFERQSENCHRRKLNFDFNIHVYEDFIISMIQKLNL